MEFPAELRGEVERLLSEENTDKLAKAAEGISARYRGNDGSGKRLVSSRRDILAYSAVRMPRDVRGCEPFAGAGSGVSPTGR